ncbi:MFS transporter [Spirochaetota bacterium]
MFMYASGANALPICLVMMSRELGFNLTQAGLLGFIPSFVQFFVLILSCFAAARFGKIRVLKTALIIMALGLLAFSSTSSYTSTVALMLMIGVGYAFLEALLTPLVEDMHPGDSGSRMNLLHAFWPIGVLMSVLIVGELLSRGVSWRLVFVGLSLATLVVLFSYPSSKHVNLPGSRTDFSHMGDILSRRRFWFLGASLFFAGGAEVSFAFWSASYIQLHFKTLPRAGALEAAIFALGMVIGRMASTRILRRVKIKHLVLVSAALALTGSLCFFLIDSLAALYGLLLFMGLSIACHWPSIQTYAARVMPVDSTVLMIFLSCFGIPGASVAPLLMGALGDRYGLKAAFIVAPIFLSLLVVSLLLEGKPCKDGHFPSIVSPGATV